MSIDRYSHKSVEPKWQKLWDDEHAWAAPPKPKGEHCYVLDMFPYPSAQGLHVGHPEGYTATDIYSRYLRLKGVSVLHPMGWDAFGLPAENYAIKTGRHPREVTWENIDTFRRQIKSLGFSYDWSREVNTADPAYYHWTQWLFLQLYKKGLAYRKEAPVNWCPSCQTVLANEQVVNGECERCQSQVEQRQMAQWFFKITDYAEALLNDLAGLDWPQPILDMQKNWIGKSEGALVKFPIFNSQFLIEAFTTRLDTIFGATYVVLAPEHPLVQQLKDNIKNWEEVENYVGRTKKKTELERKTEAKDKTGVKLEGIEAINPANQEHVPVFIADYVLTSYGTGAIMAVPAHDERDFEFAEKFGLPVRQVVAPYFLTKEGKDAIRQEKPTVKRKTICALLKHQREDKYLCLDWERFAWHSGIIGGVEEGEDVVAAAQREITEETGYTNIRFVKYVGGEVHNHFYAAHKNENRYAVTSCMLFEMIDESRKEVDTEHTKNHKSVWVQGKSMAQWLNLPVFEYMWSFVSGQQKCFVGDGLLINSGEFNDLDTNTAQHKIAEKIGAKLTTQYRLRDWLISRQRYWGAPIPIIYCAKCGELPVPEKDLPVELPMDVDFRPTGESPLQRSKSFHQVKCPKCGQPARRESDTMDTFVDSSWYFLRYVDPQNTKAAFDAKKLKQWLPVDFYVGGAEHAVMHLLYARFITKALHDLGHVHFKEPFLKLRNQGLILGEDGQKMSKSRGNVVNPDEIVEQYGADTLRLYEMFMGPLEDVKPWNTKSIIGLRRFLERVWQLALSPAQADGSSSPALPPLVARTIKKVTEDIELFRFNTAIAAFMEFTNVLATSPASEARQAAVRTLLVLLYPFAPHITSELWERIGAPGRVWEQPWPTYDKAALKVAEVTITIQVNGKVRGTVNCPVDAGEDEVGRAAQAQPTVARHLSGQTIKRTIYVPGKIINFVA